LFIPSYSDAATVITFVGFFLTKLITQLPGPKTHFISIVTGKKLVTMTKCVLQFWMVSNRKTTKERAKKQAVMVTLYL
jgi:hypothetical protein